VSPSQVPRGAVLLSMRVAREPHARGSEGERVWSGKGMKEEGCGVVLEWSGFGG